MNTSLITLATAAFMALSAPAHQRDENIRKDINDPGYKFKSEKTIETRPGNDQACDTTSTKIPSTIDLSLKEDNTY